MLVMLKPNWPGNFRRVVRDDEGRPTDQCYEFAPGEPVEVPPEHEHLLDDCLGVSLMEVVTDNKGRPRSAEEYIVDEEYVIDEEPDAGDEESEEPDADADHSNASKLPELPGIAPEAIAALGTIGVHSIEDLLKELDAGDVTRAKGIGKKTAEQLAEAVQPYRS